MKKQLFFLLLTALCFLNTYGQILGVDVSGGGQGVITWPQVYASGKQFAWAKATEGYTFNDVQFTNNMINGTNAGVIMGAYHFARPDNNSAVNEANHFLSIAGSYIGPGYLPPVLDLEDITDSNGNIIVNMQSLYSPSALTTWVNTWLTSVYNATGVAPIVYVNSNYANYLTSSLNTSLFKLWIANPNGSTSAPTVSLGIWSTWLFKQYSWTGNVSGINTDVDLNVFNGSANDFNELIGGSSSGDDYPDLVIEEMWTVPSNPQVGEDVDLYVRIKNVGDIVANNIHLEYFINGSYIDDDNHSALSPNEEQEEYENNYVFNSTGSYNYCVYIDPVAGEVNTANNSYCISVTVGNSGSNEDIYLTNALITPNSVSPGGVIDAEVDQYYSGSSNSVPDVYLYYYLSTNCTLGSTDVLLYDGDYSGIDAGDEYDTESQTLTIPSNTTPGSYYILFVADATDVINESNENNNIACVAITVTGSSAEDITVSNASVSPTTVSPGDNIDVEADQNYTGSQLDSSLPSFDFDYYLSTNCILDSNDFLLGSDSSGLGSDDPTNTENATLTIPLSVQPGTYYIIFAADNENELDEINENNNIACVQITVTGTPIPEDITLSNISVNPLVINPGDDIEVQADQNYSGPQLDADIPDNFDLDYYLSVDCVLGPEDILLGGDNSGLGSDDPTNTETSTLTIPNDTDPGIYYIIFVADSDNELYEANENNNIVCVQIEVSDPLSITDFNLNNQISLYPNPTKDLLHISSQNNTSITNLIIFDISGKVVKTVKGKNLSEINLVNISSGLYTLKIINNDSGVSFHKIIKE